MKKSILYIVNFYGTAPLNYFEKYVRESNVAGITVLKLPAVRLRKNRLEIHAFIKDEDGKFHQSNHNLFFPFPHFLVFLVQYAINFFLLFSLLSKIKRRKFDIIIGETNFGGAAAFLLKKISKASFSVFFNGDIIPDPAWSKNCFFLPNNGRTGFIYKHMDNMLINLQSFLRSIAYKNNLVWFASEKIADLDSEKHLKNRKNMINDPILIDQLTTVEYVTAPKKMDTLCYIGRIDDYVGLDVIIPALKIIKKTIPDIRLLIIGGNDIVFEKYKRLAKENGVLDRIVFYGFIPEMEKALAIMSRCALGVALYKPVKDNVSLYTQPGKPKDYIMAGLPVLLTKNGPDIGKQIVQYKAGVESDFDIRSVANVISMVLTNTNFYHTLLKGTLKFAKAYDYRVRFKKISEELFRMIYDTKL